LFWLGLRVAFSDDRFVVETNPSQIWMVARKHPMTGRADSTGTWLVFTGRCFTQQARRERTGEFQGPRTQWRCHQQGMGHALPIQ
jgi:hypothetical protein